MSASLFREKSVAEVRDISVQLSRDVVKLREEFGKALKSNYQAVVDTNEQIHSLYENIQDLDSDLLQLCFGDEDLLPRMNDTELPSMKVAKRRGSDGTYGRESSFSSSVQKQHLEESYDFNIDEVQNTLKVSSWVVALTKFKRDPSVSDSLDKLLSSFSDLPITGNVLDYCEKLGEWVITEKPSLTLDQYLSLLSLTEESKYQFDSRVHTWLFDQIVQHPDILSGSVSPKVAQFMKTESFREAMSNRLISQYEAELKNWNAHKDDEIKEPELIDPYDTDKKTSTLVKDITMYELGLTDSRRILLHDCKEKVSELLVHLKSFTSETQYRQITDKLSQMLEKERIRILEDNNGDKPSYSASNMNTLVDALLLERNNSHYVTYLSM
ncbi:Golgi transport complex subunit COG1 [Kluyveromyces lactis]|uniref:KLLA0A01430p n=1 Tax=Kluyveromyces lactis (strain ATCC 8585 / CBS 2359 / DSM 70799 / NBRC 1267 / NRRL Y-1140 / WM37) TaxID=284590 RepID=Q6CYC7_KLULA|nr:uncharacterized protein KLLA0_A01430g [Kluyveromyces lactis]CAH02650.1 KLLA0A01430p [Kluyveromyces lactis]|eukprot:XP_451062.1 uncharacterized protein KLLA0_A01430g [Kluyveromyces lactis]